MLNTSQPYKNNDNDNHYDKDANNCAKQVPLIFNIMFVGILQISTV